MMDVAYSRFDVSHISGGVYNSVETRDRIAHFMLQPVIKEMNRAVNFREVDNTIHACRKILTSNPDDETAYHNLTNSYLNKGIVEYNNQNFPMALAWFEDVLQMDPHHAQAIQLKNELIR